MRAASGAHASQEDLRVQNLPLKGASATAGTTNQLEKESRAWEQFRSFPLLSIPSLSLELFPCQAISFPSSTGQLSASERVTLQAYIKNKASTWSVQSTKDSLHL